MILCSNYFVSLPVVNVKASNIRIWIHDKDIPKLTKVLWAGQGMKLRSEISTHPRMRRFLEAVPYILVKFVFC